jgi:hypothetical protein
MQFCSDLVLVSASEVTDYSQYFVLKCRLYFHLLFSGRILFSVDCYVLESVHLAAESFFVVNYLCWHF